MLSRVLIENITIVVAIIMAVLGACFGSFAALIIFRLQKGISIVLPRSFCASCSMQLKTWHNIPIFSWIVLRGRCAYCKKAIGLRPLIIEIILSLGLLALYLKMGVSVALIERFTFLFLLVCLAYIDMDTFWLPISLLGALFAVGLTSTLIYVLRPEFYRPPSEAVSLLNTMVFYESQIFSLWNRLAGATLGFLILFIVNFVATIFLRRSGRLKEKQWAMGFGDPILLMAIGLFVGASHLVLVIFLASALGSIVGIAGRFLKKDEQLDDEIAEGALPYGPFLAIAAIYVYLF